jgi:hypothetical protein
MNSKNSLFLPNMQNFENLGAFKTPFQNKIAKSFYGPSIIPKDYHFAEKGKKETRGSQEPVIAHLVFNLTSKVDRK